MIGYYAHHVGVGHLVRARAVAARLPGELTVLSSGMPEGDDCPWLHLVRDDDPLPSDDVTASGALHWAPVRHRGMRSRQAAIAAWAERHDAALVVSDVSVEVLLLARLLSIPAVAVALRGDRSDRAHTLGFDVADRILAPWPESTQTSWPSRWLAKTTWVGPVSRYDQRPLIPSSCPSAGRCVLLLLGAGGHTMTVADLRAAASVPRTHWHVVGPSVPTAEPMPANVQRLGWVPDPWPLLCRADVVVGSAGDNAVAETAAARKPFVAVPQSRPYDEQRHQATVLSRADLAECVEPWPGALGWASVLDRAQARGGDVWAGYHDRLGAMRMAAELGRVVGSR